VGQYSGIPPKLLPVPLVPDQQRAHENVAVHEQHAAVSEHLGLDEQQVAIPEACPQLPRGPITPYCFMPALVPRAKLRQ
jgi:hypothetical protein